MKPFVVMVIATLSLLTTGAVLAQSGNMMNGGMWSGGWMGGYGGAWVPVLLAVAVIVLIAWIIKRGGK